MSLVEAFHVAFYSFSPPSHRRSRHVDAESLKRDPGSCGSLTRGRTDSAVRVLPCQATTPGLHGQVNAPTQTRLQGQEIVMICALRFGGNRTHAGASPDFKRSQTLTTRPTVFIRLVLNVPITRRMGSISFVSQCKIHHKFSPLRGDVSLRVCEHVSASLFVVYTA